MIKKNVVSFLCLLLLVAPSYAQVQTTAKQIYLYDLSTDTVLATKNAQQKMYPASMTKLMTVYLTFKQLKKGSISLNSKFLVSKKAWKKGGSKMFVRVDTLVTVSDLLRGVIVDSGNDAAIVLAEGIAGTEEAFAKRMTDQARKLGMLHTQFRNATGWPDPQHYTTAEDLGILATELIRQFPEYKNFWAQKSFVYNGIKQYNRNPFFLNHTASKLGVDLVKTGHTEISGYGLVASLEKDGRQIVFVINGLSTLSERIKESYRLALNALYDYKFITVVSKDDALGTIPVWQGVRAGVDFKVNNDIKLTVGLGSVDAIQTKVSYRSPLYAPIKKGDKVGKVTVSVPGRNSRTYVLYAAKTVKKAPMLLRLEQGLAYFFMGFFDDHRI